MIKIGRHVVAFQAFPISNPDVMNKQQIWLEATCWLRTICQQNHLMCGLRNGLT